MSKQMTFRARQRKLKRKIRNDEWSRLMGNHRAVGIEEAWSLDVYAAKYIVPRLKLLRKITHGYPNELNRQCPEGNDAFECWQSMLDKMLFAFEYYDDLYARRLVTTNEEQIRVKEGLRLFAEWYEHLWY